MAAGAARTARNRWPAPRRRSTRPASRRTGRTTGWPPGFARCAGRAGCRFGSSACGRAGRGTRRPTAQVR
jgi:hypothetical protein